MDWKKILDHILYPPGWIIALLAIGSAAGLTGIFLKGWEESPIAYAVYCISFYALSVTVLFFVKTLPDKYRAVKRIVYENPYGNKYLTDVSYKTSVSLLFTFGINMIYSVFKLVSGFMYSSLWLGAVAVYYLILALLRFLLLRYMRRGDTEQDLISEYRKYRQCGILMIFLNMVLSVIVMHMIRQTDVETPHQIVLIASATYTFYTVTVSVIDMIKYRKHESPVISAAKAIRFAAAMVSLMSLETSLLVQFGEDESFRRIMTAATGAGVGLILTAMSVYMMLKGTKEIKRLRQSPSEG